MKAKKIIPLLSFLAILISGCQLTAQVINERVLEPAQVSRVIDGDTIELTSGEKIRLLHINAPEKGEQCSSESISRLEELVLQDTIWLERDMQGTDQYDRKLRYIFLYENKNPVDYNGFVNLMLIQDGLASLFIIEPNSKYRQVFQEAFENAEGCLYQPSEFKGCFEIVEFHYDAEGNDNENPEDEYVILRNICDQVIDMNGWKIKDATASNFYEFSDVIISPSDSLILRSGSGTDSENELYWSNHGRTSRSQSVWNNDHDIFFLRDEKGNLVLFDSY